MSFRNRLIIAGANGTITLSIPLQEGRNQKSIMKDVKIAKNKWQSMHWKTLVSCYNKSPWFEFYKDDLNKLYSMPCQFLLDWNFKCFEWSIAKLKLPVKISLSEKFEANPGEGTLDLRNSILPKNYTNFGTIKYHQVFEERTGFLPNLSILDLLFCEGKNAIVLLCQ